jgi:large repetitive protein
MHVPRRFACRTVARAPLLLSGLLSACGGGGGGRGNQLNIPQGSPFLTIEDARLEEGDSGRSEVVFNVLLSAPSGARARVEYMTLERSALSGKDYLGATGRLEFPAGTTSAAIPVKVLGDRMDEEDEVFSVLLKDPENAVIDRGEALGVITDDDPAPSLTVLGDETLEERDGEVFLSVRLTPESGQPVRVEYETVAGKAKPGKDYLPASGFLFFGPGKTDERIPIRTLDDSLAEPRETFRVVLRNSMNAAILDGEATVTIVDDD